MNQPIMRSVSYNDFSHLASSHLNRTKELSIPFGKHLPLSTKSDGFLQHKPYPVPGYIDPSHFTCRTDWFSLHDSISKLVPTFEFFVDKYQWKGNWYDEQLIEEVHVAIQVFSNVDGSLMVEVQRRSGDSILFHDRFRHFKSQLTGEKYIPMRRIGLPVIGGGDSSKDSIECLFHMSQSPYIDVAIEGLKGLLWLIMQKETLKLVQEYDNHTLSLHPQDKTYTRLYLLFLERTKLNKKE